jgi:hypothetical protein
MNEDAIGWGSLALINATLAKLDGRSPFKYFIGSLLLGPIVTMIIGATAESSDGKLHLIDLMKRRDFSRQEPSSSNRPE